MMANSDGLPTRAFTSRAFPQPWMVSKFCSRRMLAIIKSLSLDHARVPLLAPVSMFQCRNRYLHQNITHECSYHAFTHSNCLQHTLHKSP